MNWYYDITRCPAGARRNLENVAPPQSMARVAFVKRILGSFPSDYNEGRVRYYTYRKVMVRLPQRQQSRIWLGSLFYKCSSVANRHLKGDTHYFSLMANNFA